MNIVEIYVSLKGMPQSHVQQKGGLPSVTL